MEPPLEEADLSVGGSGDGRCPLPHNEAERFRRG